MNAIENKIIELAKADIGIKEIPGNQGWYNKKFQTYMEACGWRMGQAWCSLWCEKIWKEAYAEVNPVFLPTLDHLFDAGAQKTYRNFLNDIDFVVDKHCVPGAVVIWSHYQNGVETWQGHAGIVINEVCQHEFDTIEGNTNSQGGREGIEVAQKKRLLNFDARSGLVLKGFIHPIS